MYEVADACWVATIDDGSGQTYYINSVTGDVSWELPTSTKLDTPDERAGVEEEKGVETFEGCNLPKQPEFSLIPVNTRVKLCGLHSKPDLNGKLGVVKGFIEASGRYSVALDDSSCEVYSFKDDNIMTISAELQNENIHYSTRTSESYTDVVDSNAKYAESAEEVEVLAQVGAWAQMWNVDQSQFYYVNIETGESRWE